MSTALGRSSPTRRRVLIAAPFVPDTHSGHGASVAIGGLLKALSDHHEVALVHLRGPEESPVHPALAARLAFVHEIQRPPVPNGRGSRAALAVGLLRGLPMWVQHWWSSEMELALRNAVADWQPDVVQLELSVMAPYLRSLSDLDVTTVVTVHDPAVPMARDARRRNRGLSWIAHALDVVAWRRAESDAFARADAVVAFTERDAVSLRDNAGTDNVRVIPLGIDVPERPCDPIGRDATVLFVGSARHPPNVAAAQHLVAELLPRIVAAVPEARLRLVGHHQVQGLTPLAERHLDRCGRVHDVRAELERAAVVVAPLHLGGGMRVKVLEALAAGKALVATSRALEGITAAEDGVAVRADTDDEFVAAVGWLLQDADARERMGRRAALWAQRNLSWRQRALDYTDLYDALLGPDVAERDHAIAP